MSDVLKNELKVNEYIRNIARLMVYDFLVIIYEYLCSGNLFLYS